MQSNENEVPTLAEQVGVSIGARNLKSEEDRERHVERIGALGAAQLVKGQDGFCDLGMELAAALLRMKYGRDYRVAAQATNLLAHRLRGRMRNQILRRPRNETLLRTLAGQVIAEWIADRCEKCDGAGVKGATMGGPVETLRACKTCRDAKGIPTGRVSYWPSDELPNGTIKVRPGPIRPLLIDCPDCRGRRYTVDRKHASSRLGRTCSGCGGTGEAAPRHGERARILGVSLDAYERHWKRWYTWAMMSLQGLDNHLLRRLRHELQ